MFHAFWLTLTELSKCSEAAALTVAVSLVIAPHLASKKVGEVDVALLALAAFMLQHMAGWYT